MTEVPWNILNLEYGEQRNTFFPDNAIHFQDATFPFWVKKRKFFSQKMKKGPLFQLQNIFFSHKKQTLFSFMINRFRVSSSPL
jgi:hypothetical protein